MAAAAAEGSKQTRHGRLRSAFTSTGQGLDEPRLPPHTPPSRPDLSAHTPRDHTRTTQSEPVEVAESVVEVTDSAVAAPVEVQESGIDESELSPKELEILRLKQAEKFVVKETGVYVSHRRRRRRLSAPTSSSTITTISSSSSSTTTTTT